MSESSFYDKGVSDSSSDASYKEKEERTGASFDEDMRDASSYDERMSAASSYDERMMSDASYYDEGMSDVSSYNCCHHDAPLSDRGWKISIAKEYDIQSCRDYVAFQISNTGK